MKTYTNISHILEEHGFTIRDLEIELQELWKKYGGKTSVAAERIPIGAMVEIDENGQARRVVSKLEPED